jgi:hypothetical protein
MNEGNIVSAESLPAMVDSSPEPDAEGARLREQAVKADYGVITPDSQAEEPKADKPEDSTQKDQQRAADAEPKTEADKSDSLEASAEDQKPESSYQKRKKELEAAERRQNETWKKLDEGKLKWQARMQQQLEQLQQQLVQQNQAKQKAQGPRFSSQHLAAAVDEFEATAMKALNEGDSESAQKNFDLARKARQAAQESYFAEQKEEYQKGYQAQQQSWDTNCKEVFKEAPELMDVNSEIGQQMMQLLNAKPVLREYPDGFKDAYEHLKALRLAAEASKLKEEKASLEKQLKELQQRTSITGSGPTPRSERNISDLPTDEQGEQLRRQLDSDRLAYA